MYNKIKNYLKKGIYPFHMPGHKRNPVFLPKEIFKFDLTEIPGMDVLNKPTDIILDFQRRLAKLYNAKETFFLTNGASTGVIASVLACCKHGQRIYAQRNSHVSFYNALILSGAYPEYIMPDITEFGIPGTIKHINHLQNNPVVFITSPTYEGLVSDIGSFSKKIHELNGILIVDEAHGSHFPFHSYFPDSAINSGADIVIHSLHKTMPALGQTALVHVCSDRVDIGRLKFFINAVQTTSPSYMFMGACDFMFKTLEDSPELFISYVNRLKNIRNSLPDSNAYIRLFDTADKGKLLFLSPDSKNISDILRHSFKLEMELACENHFLAMTSVADTDDGFYRLLSAIETLNSTPPIETNINLQKTHPPEPEIVILPQDAVNMPYELVPAKKAIGRISAELIVSYPPGIPVVAVGERIQEYIEQDMIKCVL